MAHAPTRSLPFAVLYLLVACGDDSAVTVEQDAGAVEDAGSGTPCENDLDCDDTQFCNGRESCGPAGRCVPGEPVVCDDGIACTRDVCSHGQNRCEFLAPDEDGDGHLDADCLGPDGESLGTDCDDADPDRYPGNPERCDLDAPEHDEDCDDESFGVRDDDQDGFVSDACCAGEGDARVCGDDCDDGDASRFPDHPEICDEIDNDCDGTTDIGTREVPWYLDADGDGYGAPDSEPVQSCAPIEGRSLRDTDCDDARAAVHPAAREVCDQLDNDCDEDRDEGGVCLCSPAGARQACACAENVPGTQTCVEGTWSDCDCRECVNGVRDCLGDLLPRECVMGRWVVQASCTGARPLCLAGACVCADGTTDCDEVDDVVAPFVFGTSPADGTEEVPVDTVVSVVFSEAIAPSTLTAASFSLYDAWGNPVAADVAVGGQGGVLTPTSPLRPGTPYTVVVARSVGDLAGNGLLFDASWEFITAPGVSPATITPARANAAFDSPRVAVNAGGDAVLAMNEIETTGDIIVPGARLMARVSGSWVADMPLPTMLMQRRGMLAIEDSGTAFVLAQAGASATLHELSGGTWSVSPAAVQATGTVGLPLAVDGSGAAIVCLDTALSELGYLPRLAGGAFGAAVVMEVGGPSLIRADMGPGGHAAIAWLQPGSLELWHSQADLTAWGRAPSHLPAAGTITDLDVSANGAGEVVRVWVEDVFIDPLAMVPAVWGDVVGTDHMPLGVPTLLAAPSGFSPQAEPQVEVDAMGRAIVAFRDYDHVYAGRYLPATGFESATRLTPDASRGVDLLRLAVAPSGAAALAWVQQEWAGVLEVRNLWVARYSPASGWEQPWRVTTSAVDVATLDLAIDGSGDALLVWEDSGSRGLRTLDF